MVLFISSTTVLVSIIAYTYNIVFKMSFYEMLEFFMFKILNAIVIPNKTQGMNYFSIGKAMLKPDYKDHPIYKPGRNINIII